MVLILYILYVHSAYENKYNKNLNNQKFYIDFDVATRYKYRTQAGSVLPNPCATYPGTQKVSHLIETEAKKVHTLGKRPLCYAVGHR